MRGRIVRGYITRFFKETEWDAELIETLDLTDADAVPHYIQKDDGKFYEYYGFEIPKNKKVYLENHD